MASTPEGRLQRKCRAAMEAHAKGRNEGIYINKTHGGPHSPAGVPDFTGCYRGWYFGIEIKAGKNKPTEKQRHHLNLIRQAKGVSAVARTPEAAVRVLKLIDKYEDF